MLDAGDALSPSNMLMPEQKERVEKTAELIVQQYAVHNVEALAVGDRDLALGRDFLLKLAGSTKVPFLSTNLVDSKTAARVFKPYLVVERGGLRIQVLALIGPRAERMAGPTLEMAGVRVEPFVDATKRAIAELTPPADLVVVLSQLSEQEEGELVTAVPAVKVLLGGDAMAMATEVSMHDGSVAANGAQKGKQVGLLTISLDDDRGPSAPFVDPGRRQSLEAKRAMHDQRIKSLEKIIADAKGLEAQPAPEPKPDPNKPQRPIRKAPIEAYERQLAGARAELQLAADELASLPAKDATTGNVVAFELVSMDTTIADEPATKAAVDAFRKVYPDPSKPPPPPQPPVVPGEPQKNAPEAPHNHPH